jgi:cell shape-determining protein MreC
MAIKKENALPVASVLACIATALALWSGVFDRGATSGSMTEKVTNIEVSVNKINDWISDRAKEDIDDRNKYFEVQTDIVRLQEQLTSVKRQIEDLEQTKRELQQERKR